MRIVLKALFGLLLVALLVWRLDPYAIGMALARYRWPWLMGGLALMVASWPVAAMRWKLFANRFRYTRLLGLTLVGQFYAIALPGQLAGEVVKAWRLAKGQADAERLAATVLLDRIIGTISLLVVAGAGIAFSTRRLPKGLAPFFASLIFICALGIFALNLAPMRNTVLRVIARLDHTRLEHVGRSLRRAIEAWREFGQSPQRLAASLGLGLVFQLLGMCMFVLLSDNLAIHLPLAHWAWILGLVSLADLIPVSVGGIGLREGALVGCLGFLGISGEKALALSFGIFAMTLSGAIVGGVLELIESLRRERLPAKSRDLT